MKTMFDKKKQGCIKLPFPPGGNFSSCWGRREGEGKRKEGKGKRRGKRLINPGSRSIATWTIILG